MEYGSNKDESDIKMLPKIAENGTIHMLVKSKVILHENSEWKGSNRKNEESDDDDYSEYLSIITTNQLQKK